MKYKALKGKVDRGFFNLPILKNQLRENHIVPPFSILDARQGYWQARKRLWLSLGIKSELGRGEMNPGSPGDTRHDPAATYQRKNKKPLSSPYTDRSPQVHSKGLNYFRDKKKKTKWIPEVNNKHKRLTCRIAPDGSNSNQQTGTSIFDPVLCEIMYKWFCPEGGKILDPFAGGSVRGIVAGYLDFHYTGIDLSGAQIIANRKQAKEIVEENMVDWIEGDSVNVEALTKEKYDFIFSCPPYYNLEVYGDDPNDLSNANSYDMFIRSYYKIIKNCVSLLKDDRFACFVVANFRNKKGFYCNLVGDTIRGFEKQEAFLYNDCILVTCIGSLPIRVGQQFGNYRKIGKTHQNILIFYKGDPKKIPNLFGEKQ